MTTEIVSITEITGEDQLKNSSPTIRSTQVSNGQEIFNSRSDGSGDLIPNVSPFAIDAASDDNAEEDFPEGGTQAWTVVIGSLAGLFSTTGIVNSLGALQAYISSNQLENMSESQVSWIFSLLIFLGYILSGLAGPLFDAYGPRYLTMVGTVFFVGGIMSSSVCTQYYQFVLGLGVCTGIGFGLLLSPLFTIVGHWFNHKRGFATGIATIGGSMGGIAFPLMLRKLYNTVGFGWAVRIVGFVCFTGLAISLLLIKSRLERTEFRISFMNFVDIKSLKDLRFVWLILANFLGEVAVIVGVTFLVSYALAQGKSDTLAYSLLTILSFSAIFGRWVSGIIADSLGRFNTLIFMCALAAISVLAIWLPFGHTTIGLVCFAIINGYCNGAIFSLFPVCCSQICRTEDYGKRFGTMFFFASFGALLGVPVSASLIKDKNYTNLVIFTGVLYFLTTFALFLSRRVSVGYRWCKI